MSILTYISLFSTIFGKAGMKVGAIETLMENNARKRKYHFFSSNLIPSICEIAAAAK